MHIKKLRLQNFRNYNAIDIDFCDRVNLLLGNNAQGKTNLVEAIEYLALVKSHRTAKDSELIQWGEEHAGIRADACRRNRHYNLEVNVYKKGKKIRVNGIDQRKTSEYIGLINVVLFSPEDLQLVKGGPQFRRRFMDVELGQVSPTYLHDLSQYQKVLLQRNNLLKEFSRTGKVDLSMLDIWDDQLVFYGIRIMNKRIEFIDKLKAVAHRIHAQIADSREELSLEYVSTADTADEEGYKTKLQRSLQADVARGHTSVGPHRDDILLYVNGVSASVYGSQGQQRTAALSLKLAEIDFVFQEIGEYPILILDDVLSELDDMRQRHLVQTVGASLQTFITSTSKETIDGLPMNTLTCFVSNGHIIPEG